MGAAKRPAGAGLVRWIRRRRPRRYGAGVDGALVVAVVLLILLALVVAGLSFRRRNERQEAEKKLIEARAAVKEAHKERDKAAAGRDEALEARLQADKHLVEARKDAQRATSKVTDLEQRVAEAREAVSERDELSRATKEQANQLASLETELMEAKARLSSVDGEVTAAKQRAGEAEKELAAADRRVAEIEKDVHDELHWLRSQLADARDDLALAQSEAEQARTASTPAPAVHDRDRQERAVTPSCHVIPAGVEAVGLWDLELLRLQRNAASIDQARVVFSDNPGEALVQALGVEVSALRDLVGTGGEVHAESLPPISPATALVALRVSQEILGAIARQCDRLDMVVSDEDGLTVTVAGLQPDDPVDPMGVVGRLMEGARSGGVDLAEVREKDAYLVVANFARVEQSAPEPSDTGMLPAAGVLGEVEMLDEKDVE